MKDRIAKNPATAGNSASPVYTLSYQPVQYSIFDDLNEAGQKACIDSSKDVFEVARYLKSPKLIDKNYAFQHLTALPNGPALAMGVYLESGDAKVLETIENWDYWETNIEKYIKEIKNPTETRIFDEGVRLTILDKETS